MNNWLQFALLVSVLTMLPGIDTAQVLRSSIKGGPKLGYTTLFGIMLGVWAWGIATAVGLSAILLASSKVYTAIKYVGAAYLFYLGAKMIWAAKSAHGLEIGGAQSTESSLKTMSRALLITITNPKNGAFYIAVLPQFVPHGMNPFIAGLILSTIHNGLGLIWFSGIISLTRFAKDFFAKPRVTQVMEALSGTVLLGFGARMLLEKSS
jgi:threonine/homoserine/homoserine lactone efflux protein